MSPALKKTRQLPSVALLIAVAGSVTWSTPLTKFQRGTPAVADSMNANFAALDSVLKTKSDAVDVLLLKTALATKSDRSALDSLGRVKADQAAVTDISVKLGTKVSKDTLDSLLASKVNQSDLQAMELKLSTGSFGGGITSQGQGSFSQLNIP